jgi:hypothetical protein
MTMSGPHRISAEAFAADQLRAEPNLAFAELRDRAKAAGVALQPIHYGRARKLLGLPALVRAPSPSAPPAPQPTKHKPVAAASRRDERAHDDDDETTSPVDDGPAPFEPEPPTPAPVPTPAPAPAVPGDLVAPRRKGSAAFDFLVQELRREPTLSYGDLKRRAEALGHPIAPIMYGRAKAVLGLVPVRPRGSRKEAATVRAASGPMQLKQVESVAADRFTKKLDEVRNLDQLVAIVKDLEHERRRLRDVLEKIVDLIDAALG